ncbi:MAG: hypothetical protein FJ096_11990 [Deltaproteobacteria bacterium]|nr:hypothetical protein [Deltaproteobacteria bacterium]
MSNKLLSPLSRWLIALTVGAVVLAPQSPIGEGDGTALAQSGSKKGGKDKDADKDKGSKKSNKPIDLDEEGGDSGSSGGDVTPVNVGDPSEEAAQAKRLYDEKRYGEAALMFKKVIDGETSDDEGNKLVAGFYLAGSLYNLKFYQASYDIFRKIADKKDHPKYKETLNWLARLATHLPEPADITSAVGKYSKGDLENFNNDQRRDVFYQLNYLLGRSMYRNREWQEAIELFSNVKEASPYFVKSQFFMGISNVQEKKSVPAIRAFQRILAAMDKGIEGVEDEDRMRDLANLSIARTFYSASIRLDENNVPKIDDKKLNAAVRHWNLVDVGSEYWLDTLFEQSWAYFMAGDYPRALGNIHTIQSPYFPGAFYPEADIVRAVIYFTTCQYDDATPIVARFQRKYEPVEKELRQILKRFESEGSEQAFYDFVLKIRDGKSDLSPAVAPIVEYSLSDRELLRNIEYVKVLDGELERLKGAPSGFRNGTLGTSVEEGINAARTEAVRKTGELARRRYTRNVSELQEHLRSAQKIIIDITNAQRKKIDEEIEAGRWSAEDAFRFGQVTPDEEHVIWPFSGEYWRDELGYYRQVVNSACGGGKAGGTAGN